MTTLAADGDAVLRRRSDGTVELRVGGVFVMDDVETGSERALARTVDLPGEARVLVGGLGLGFTAREMLGRPEVARLTIVEIEPALETWMRAGLIAGVDVLDDPRVSLTIADLREVVEGWSAGPLDAIVMDVDNGPDFLVRERNADLYGPEFVARCAAALGPTGTLAIWSQADSRRLRETLAGSFAEVATREVPVRLQERDTAYWLLTGRCPVACRHER